ncbi:MAG: F0F1 ATP synthase subunit B [Hyphomicrobiaceae bacterium]
MAQPHTTEVGVPHDAGHSKAFPPLDPNVFVPQLVWLAITFAILYALLSRIALPRIGEVIEERRDRIQRDLDHAESLKGETEKALKDYEQSFADARAKAGAIARETRDKLSADTDRERKAMEDKVAAQIADSEARIKAMKDKALASVSDIAADTASAIVGKLIGEDVSAAEAKKAL